MPDGAHILATGRHAQTAVQTNIGTSRFVGGATAAMLSGRVAWREGVVEFGARKAVALLIRCRHQRGCVKEREDD